MKNEKNQKLTIQDVYNQLAIFFLGTISFIILYILGNFLIQNTDLNFIAQILAFLFLLCYFINVASFTIYYLTKISKFFREKYDKYSLYYWGFAIFIFLILILVAGYFVMGSQKLWETTISTLLVIVLGAIGWFIKKIYEAKIKKI